MSKITQIKAIIDSYTTGYNGDYFPNSYSLDEIDAALPKYFINLTNAQYNSGYDQKQTFPIELRATSQINLDAMLAAFLALDSRNPSGYEFSTAGYPHWLEVRDTTDLEYYDINEFQAYIEIEATWSV